tara:strand:- start:6962 stop:7105 length:144 start_codon:yes stop_codon:yes gene_type:complete
MEVIQRFLDWLKPDWTESRIYGDQDDPDEIEEDEDDEPTLEEIRGGQ